MIDVTSAADANSRDRSAAFKWPTNAWAGALLGAALAVPALAWFWGFTVDDALISARIAHHVATGVGYRFNVGGPAVDAVTPLGYAVLLAPFARVSPEAALGAAKLLGAAGWLAAAALLGARVTRRATRLGALAPLAVVAFCAPLAVWAVSGMETGLVTLLCTLALAGRTSGALAAGAAAAWRPELIPWAVALSGMLAFSEASPDQRILRVIERCTVTMVLPVSVAIVRWRAFGHAAPLAVLAKPADLGQGFNYALAALLGTGPAWLLVAPVAVRRLDAPRRGMLLAIAVHFVAIALAGGDWMWLYRLAVPVLPSMIVVGSAIAEKSAWPATLVRVVVACAASVATAAPHAFDARHIGARRARLIQLGRPMLAQSHAIATVDVGWVGAAAPHDAVIVDLAGATDLEIAALPGSHTSKRLYAGLLEARDVDAMVLLLAPRGRAATPWSQSSFAREVEARVADLSNADAFAPAGTLPLGGAPQDYLVVLRSH